MREIFSKDYKELVDVCRELRRELCDKAYKCEQDCMHCGERWINKDILDYESFSLKQKYDNLYWSGWIKKFNQLIDIIKNKI